MTRKTLEIDVEGLAEWVQDMDVLYASDSYTGKRLAESLLGVYTVSVCGREVHSGYDMEEAVRAYNEITKKAPEPQKFTL